jgi:repressor of nif and glnA expression
MVQQMSFIRSERKCLEILRILREHQEPVGAKRLSEVMAERGFVLSDRAVQYYLSYLDEMGFTRKIGNRGRVLTPAGRAETESALVEERIGYIISKLERLAFRSTFNPETATGDVAYNLSIVPEDQLAGVCAAFDEVLARGIGFFSSYRIVDDDPRVPSGHAGIITVCSITMDGVLQRRGVPVKMAYGGRIAVRNFEAVEFVDLIGYRGTTVDPLWLFITAGMTSIRNVTATGRGIALANVREVPADAHDLVQQTAGLMRESGFLFPVSMGSGIFNLRPNPYRLSIIAFSGMNLIGNGIEKGYSIQTEIGAGNIPYAKIID